MSSTFSVMKTVELMVQYKDMSFPLPFTVLVERYLKSNGDKLSSLLYCGENPVWSEL